VGDYLLRRRLRSAFALVSSWRHRPISTRIRELTAPVSSPRSSSWVIYRDMTDQKIRQIKSHCPNCGPGRYANVIYSHDASDYDDESGISEKTTSFILECGGCKTVFFQEDYVCSEDCGPDGRPEKRITYYPAPVKRKRPEWFSLLDLEPGLYSLLKETYNALDVDARVLSATGARTIFDRASELLKIHPALTFKEKLNQLQNKGHISASERKYLDILTDASGAAAHRGWKPTAKQLNTVMTIVETFIHRKFVLEAEVKGLKAQLPRRRQRPKKKRP
jgi:hypothetical protein